MNGPEQPPPPFVIRNKAPNQGAQGVFNAPVYLGIGSSVARDRHNRSQMLKRVHAFWIKGVLEQSLHGAALIALGLREQSNLVENPWRVFQEVDGSVRSSPDDRRIIQVYDDTGGELLILGAPGAGKTTLLLELTRVLLERAAQNETLPIPVVFNLSSWIVKQQSIGEWLVKELLDTYQVPYKISQPWVESDQILPLLDGLDEVQEEVRAACINAINNYRKEHGLLPTVICSRITEYSDLIKAKHQLRLRGAVVVQPLTIEQIESYLSNAGEQLAAVRVALSEDRELQEIAATPLMISVLALAYHGVSVEDLLKEHSPEARRRQIFATYIKRMLQQPRGSNTHYSLHQTVHRLMWLASQLVQHDQTEFYIERMDPDWLIDPQSHQFYASLLTGRISRLFVRLLDGRKIQPAEVLAWSWTSTQQSMVGFLRDVFRSAWLIPLLVSILVYLLFLWLLGTQLAAQLAALCGIFLIGWNCAAVEIYKQRQTATYQYRRSASLFGDQVAKGLFADKLLAAKQEEPYMGYIYRRSSLTTGLVRGLLLGLVVGLLSNGLNGAWVGEVVGGGIGILVSALLNGMSSGLLEEYRHMKPNQGVWRSARNGVLAGLMSGIISSPIGGLLSGWLFHGQTSIIIGGLLTGMLSGVFFGLRYGGTECLKHIFLRLLLRHADYVPWNYPRFLDYATEHILLRKVGGGYIFVHRLLLEYFASLGTKSNPDEVAEQVQNT